MKSINKTILVYADWAGLPETTAMGSLSAVVTRGKETFAFEYDETWLKSNHLQDIDPDLGMFTGRQFVRDEKSNFGLFLDSSPDRWGRLLMKRREAVLARIEERKEDVLLESDYLLGVYDEHRMGALRFKINPQGDFLSNNRAFSTPPWTSLRELEQACLKLEEDSISNDLEYLRWLNMLIAPGSSLGGARPKASVVDAKGALWIAKFPSINDTVNMGAWEMVVNKLGQMAGVNVADAMAQTFNSKQHTFLTKRFDRTAKRERIHFASAMTLLGYTDGVDSHDGVSYLELVEFIIRRGATVEKDLAELFRRIVFSICVSNTDDHLRNHGFILTPTGWILSPAYDINPNPDGTGLKLNISESDNSLSLDVAKGVAPYFRLKQSDSEAIIHKVIGAVSHWRIVAGKIGLSKTEQDRMSRAFENFII